jgi:hypothetical protein
LLFVEWMLRIAVLLTPWLALFISARASRNRYRFFLALVSIVVVYWAFVTFTWAVDARLEAELNAFDLDHDGSFSLEESTPAAEDAMRAWTTDTGRSLAPFTGLVTAPLYVLFVFVVVPLVTRFAGRLTSSTSRRV